MPGAPGPRPAEQGGPGDLAVPFASGDKSVVTASVDELNTGPCGGAQRQARGRKLSAQQDGIAVHYGQRVQVREVGARGNGAAHRGRADPVQVGESQCAEDRVHDERTKNGIPLPTGTWQKLEAASKRFGIPLPAKI